MPVPTPADENQTSDAIITLEATDPENDSLTWTIATSDDDSHFQILNDNQLHFRSDKNYESFDDDGGDGTYNITIQARDPGGLTARGDFQIELQNVNEAPSIAITGGPFDADENQTSDTIVTLTASDVDSGDDAASFTWSIVDPASGGEPDASHFQITGGNELRFRSPKNYESFDDDGGDGTYDVTLQVSDDESLTDTLNIQVRLQNVNEAPSITITGGPFDADENQTSDTIVTLTASDVDSGDDAASFTWSIVDPASGGEPDASHFQITGGNELRFSSSKNYESFDDDGGDGTYDVTLQVSDDESLTDTLNIQVRLQNVNEAPSIAINGWTL